MSRLEQRTIFSNIQSWPDEDLTPDIMNISGFGNTGVVITEEGVVIVDGVRSTSSRAVEAIRDRTQVPIHTIIYTHGHGDHTSGAQAFMEDAKTRGHTKPRIIAHELVPRRFDKYKKLRRWRQFIGQHQGGRGYALPTGSEPSPPFEAIFPYPDITYSDAMQFRLGGLTFELYHATGETDDATWVWIPERKTAFAGDLILGFCPNIGNPLKEQRYALEWAEALERIVGKNPDFMIPGHYGILGRSPVLRGEEIKEVCLDTARFLRHLHDEVIRLMNEGCWYEEIMDKVSVPADLADKPWLSSIYGCPTYVLHGILRRYTGFYNGNPSELFPARSWDIAAEVVRVGGTQALLERAVSLQQEGNLKLALHLVDFIIKGAQDTSKRKEALLLKAELLDASADSEVNGIARNILLVGAQQAEDQANSL